MYTLIILRERPLRLDFLLGQPLDAGHDSNRIIRDDGLVVDEDVGGCCASHQHTVGLSPACLCSFCFPTAPTRRYFEPHALITGRESSELMF